MGVGEVTPGYELWHPNREKADVVTTRYVVAALMVATAVLTALVTITGFNLINGGATVAFLCLLYTPLYALFAYRVVKWSRGTLPVAAALSMILAIFCAAGANSWFARDKAGFEEAMLPVPIIGLLVLLIVVVQLLLIAAAFYGFSQDWHVEEERPIGSGEDYGAGAPQPV